MEKNTNLKLAKKLNIAAIIVSVVVLFIVGFMRQVKLDSGIDFTFLPPVYSTLNAICAVFLGMALYQIKNKNIKKHQLYINIALGCSVVFLVCYVLYHFTTPETKYCHEGSIRYLYFFLLITHIILAAVILPFILFTYIRGFTGQIEKHRKMAKIVFPLWFYVAVTGPIIYFMLKDCY
ncbi:MAG: putative membrane protein [Saprospiraceae bacterium]|jgi:putative membrane protein